MDSFQHTLAKLPILGIKATCIMAKYKEIRGQGKRNPEDCSRGAHGVFAGKGNLFWTGNIHGQREKKQPTFLFRNCIIQRQ